MTKRKLYALLSRISELEGNATTVKQMQYWQRHWRRLHDLARQKGWIA